MSAMAKREAEAPESDLGNFAEWYRHLRLESDDRPLLDDLREAVEGFVTMDLKDAGLGNRVLKVTLSSQEGEGKARNDPYDFHELSDGQRVLIGLYSVLHFGIRSGATVCFDEPDNFIALREIQPWLNKLIDRVEGDSATSQVLIASHHPELLNRMALQNGLVLDRPGGRHTRARRFDDPLQTGLSPAELVARGWERE
jgi:predicted ATPase